MAGADSVPVDAGEEEDFGLEFLELPDILRQIYIDQPRCVRLRSIGKRYHRKSWKFSR